MIPIKHITALFLVTICGGGLAFALDFIAGFFR